MADKEQLTQLAARLNQLGGAIPARAASFHEMRTGLLDRIAKANRRNPFFGQTDTDALLREGREIEALAPALRTLFAECDALSERATQIELLARNSADPAIAPTAQERLAAARASLLPIGANCRTAASVAAGWSQVAGLGQRIETEARALPLFSEAVGVHQHLSRQDELAAAVMAADMAQWRKQYLEGKPAGEWIVAAEQTMGNYRQKVESRTTPEPLRPRVRPAVASVEPPVVIEPTPIQQQAPAPRAPKVSLMAVENLLSECRQWAEAFTGDIEEVRPLMDRKQKLLQSATPPPDEVEALAADVKARRDKLRASVMETCAARLKALRSRLALFMEICGDDSELRGLLAKVERQGFDTPDDFELFEEALRKATSKFDGTANNEQERLNDYLGERCDALRIRAAGLGTKRRKRDAEKKLRELEQRIPARASAPPAADESLAAIEVCIELNGEFASLDRACLAASGHLEREVGGAGQRLLHLRLVGDLLDTAPGGDFSTAQRILDGSGAWPQDAIIDDCEETLQLFELHFGREEQKYRKQAEGRLDAEAVFFRMAERDLGQANRLFVEPYAMPAPVPGDDLSVVAQRLESAAVHRDALERELAKACAEYRDSLVCIETRLHAIADAPGQDSVREIAGELIAEAETLPRAGDANGIENFRALRSWVQQCETFFYSVELDQNEARDEAKELRELAHGLRKQSRHIYHPGLFDRAMAVVGGAGLGGASAAESKRQLAGARAMLKALEHDSLRAIVHEMGEGCGRLRELIAQTRDAAFLKNARRVLDEIEALEHTEIPPLALRRELSLLTRIPLGGARRVA